MRKTTLFICLLMVFSCQDTKENSQGENFTNNVNKVATTIVDDSEKLLFFNHPIQPIQPEFIKFSIGSVKPKGWILEMMQNDLEKGVVGALDELYPGIKSDNLYHTARRGGMEDIPEMGDLVLTGAEWEKSIMWWNAETIGNWWDGFIRHAFLTENEEAIQQSHKIIDNLLTSQDKDGYIGIYKPNLRFQHKGSNGELWAQTTAFRTMLAYYEFTNEKKVLDAVKKAMQVTMKHYDANSKNPFDLKNEFGGVTHGLMLTDVCETLYRITGDTVYQNYATYLYKAFSTYSINRSFNDLRYPFLIEKDSLFEGHAVHTYEHIRSMANAYFNTGYPELKTAYTNMLAKLEPCILPSGAGHGNEWIAKLEANPDDTGSEYCTMLELRNSYGSLLQKTGEVTFADSAEKLTYNAMLGARNSDGTAITYGKTDNCYVLDGKHHQEGKSIDDPRYKYSPTHSEPAVCCVPNYTKNLPTFLDLMYMKKEDGIAIVLFGPSELKTYVDQTKIQIEQETNYPISDEITIKLTIEKPISFTIYLRKPKWSNNMDISIKNASVQLENGYYKIKKEWNTNESFSITFQNDINKITANNGEVYLQRGPLVYAYSIPHREEVIKTYSDSKFRDYYCFPDNRDFVNLKLTKDSKFTLISNGSSNSFYTNHWYLEGELFDSSSSKNIRVNLIPMGKTILRRVTFPLK
ncbi:hypothetical protein FJ651_00100 [Paucihalobacter ruber]|uniref:Uncharacterized protein n=1 Tax=Paucihalobacter ruber TaxID=2567861 RepID=A0A506PT16_9FLAO|nr:beta-L-arabinofuranosidase domain-containing protein [Paucihalobacter ruber]TPV35360.1 hypothetical protein FJ651_00100 [Paucihalobacter ruber]